NRERLIRRMAMSMKHGKALLLGCVALACLSATAATAGRQAQEKLIIKIPQPGVSQIMTMEGNFVRASYNNEGYVILGYQLANRSVGEDWMRLEVGITCHVQTPA